MKKPEVLAPVGGEEQLIAAVRAGADAVYLGTTAFNARRSAHNFDAGALEQAVRYCHGRGVAVHVTLNTLVKDDELAPVLRELETICQAGADAVIVQDLAIARFVREQCPDLAMHASTQMTIHNAAGAKILESLGFRRIVLARELSLAEIRAVAESTSLEIETFVHGALCMCVSGGCYLSAMLGGRSGNRGRCAQPCRLDFRSPDGREYALSLKDMSHLSAVQDLAQAGVCSLKIEGRMKRPEYVAAAVSACRAAVDGKDYDQDILRNVFSRSGFTDGYLTGRRTLGMFGHRTREDVEGFAKVAGKTGELVRAERRSVPVDLSLRMHAGEPVSLRVSDGTHSARSEGPEPQIARTRPTDSEAARRSLEKTGNTPFFLRSFEADIEPGLMLPASALNELRRSALDDLLKVRSAPAPRLFFAQPFCASPPYESPAVPVYRARCETAKQLEALRGDDFDRLILPLRELIAKPVLAEKFPGKLIAELPALIFPDSEKALRKQLDQLRALGLRDVLCENIGAIQLALDAGLNPHGGHGLNILNSEALCEYERLGLRDATLSFELDLERIRRLGGVCPRGVLAYGYLPLMRFRACPMQHKEGCGSCDGAQQLTDRRGEHFTVLCSERRYQTLLNTLPLFLNARENTGVDFLTLYFTCETPAEAAEAAAQFLRNERPSGRFTNGLYLREIE